MNRLRLFLLVGLCGFVALLGIGYVTVGMKDEEPQSETSAAGAQSTAEAQATTDALLTTDESTTQDETTTKAETTTQPTTAKPEPTTEPETEGEAEKISDYEYAYAGFNPSVAAVSSENWNLLLVNQDYILPESFKVKTASVKGGSQSLDYRVVPYYNDMITAAEADGISLIPVSGYRSIERQRNNFERKINYYKDLGYNKAEATRLASKIVLMPGTSEHNAGLAMDFGTNGNYTLDENFAKTDAFKWLEKNAADYGFILRYEEHTQDITKITYEPWHWRYVGVKAAKEIKASGVTLEEYLGMA